MASKQVPQQVITGEGGEENVSAALRCAYSSVLAGVLLITYQVH
jgi:hypothetical protein